MKTVYLVWAIVGAVVPILFFLGVFHEEMVTVSGFVPALFANGAAGGFTADLLITSFVFWTYLFTSASRTGGPSPWPFVAMNLLVGLSLALPAYLYWREAKTELA